MKVLRDRVDTEAEHCDVQKGLIRDRDPCLSEIRSDFEFDLIKTAQHASPFGDGVQEVTIFSARPFGNDLNVRVQPAQADRQTARGHPARNIDCMNRNPARLVLVVCHPVVPSAIVGKPVTGRATMQSVRTIDGRG